MSPRLIVISGMSNGDAMPIGGKPFSIGRNRSNTLALDDPAVSDRHCHIEHHDGAYELIDDGSESGTFVNGIPVLRKRLADQDTLRIGNSELLFALKDSKAADASVFRQTELEDPDRPANGELKTIALDHHSVDNRLETAIGHMARDLAALLRISVAINSIRDRAQLEREILRLIIEVVPADDAAVVLVAQSDSDAASVTAWSRKGGERSSIAVRGDIVRKTIWERSAATLDIDQAADGNRHVLCVPLVAVERTLGVLYLASTQAAPPFRDDHIHFVISVSRIVAVALENVLTLDALSSENRQLKEQIFSSRLVGESRVIRKLESFIQRVAGDDVTVLVRGESGTGKELVARSIHQNGPRASRPFIAINCAAIPETLLESELFGHEKGAFTGATALKKGKLEAAEDGTLFLDEIGELAPLLQAKLLRALQQKEFERLGGHQVLRFRARVIAATNKDLEKAITSGEFRADLYYRLNVISVTVPPLRERREDIPLLALYFASKCAATRKRSFKGISPEARRMLMNYSWPGNIRELENAIEHAIVLGVSDEIVPDDLPDSLVEQQDVQSDGSRYHAVINNTKKELIQEALRNASGNFPEAAKALGVHPKYLFRLVRNLGLRQDAS
jgi:Nif-specific regulatory protein